MIDLKKRGYYDYHQHKPSIFDASFGDAPFIMRRQRVGERVYPTGGPLPGGEVGNYSDFSKFHHVADRDRDASEIRRDEPWFEIKRPRIERWKTTSADLGNWMTSGRGQRFLPVKGPKRTYLENEHGKVYRHWRWQNTLMRPGFVAPKCPPGIQHPLRYIDHDHLEFQRVSDPGAPMWNIIKTTRVLKPTPGGR